MSDITIAPKASTLRILKLSLVADTVGLSATHVRRLVADNKFPQPIPLSAGRQGWIESEVQDWLRSRIDERNELQKARIAEQIPPVSPKRLATSRAA